ncbi:unnamed protein product [Moneuplotes crassus]|uniref:Uncharacterized protein n=1 Tax=Euplotes crassus TaxID=5936 RepID=A0AAD2CWS5_EUPCR|nr:unnamed protein product [Moneuplotes crassus]
MNTATIRSLLQVLAQKKRNNLLKIFKMLLFSFSDNLQPVPISLLQFCIALDTLSCPSSPSLR